MGAPCTLCPRECGVDRETTLGACGSPAEILVSKAMLHHWEEPVISGTRGSGAIFFSGCPLKCIFCQNKDISHGGVGKGVSVSELAKIMLDLQKNGAHNINLVTPTHYSDKILEALKLIKGDLKIPVVYNTSGYEKASEIEKIADHVSIFLTDIKYFSPELSKKYSSAPDYYEVARDAFSAMLKASPKCEYDKNGLMTSGVILRHLVLPSHRQDSISLLSDVASSFDVSKFKLSLMSQYTPDFYEGEFKELKRKLTSFEYESVLEHAMCLGFDGYMQELSSSNKSYTPEF